jgi:carbamoyl-phosphate synthase large subunit
MEGMEVVRVLMTGGGAPGAAGIIGCLRDDARVELHVGDANEWAVGRFLNERFLRLPKASDPGFVDFLLEHCVRNGIRVVFPLVTRELLLLAEARARFASQGVHVIVSDPVDLGIANDKSALLRHLSARGIPTPDFEVVAAGDLEGVKAAFRRLGYPGRPLAVKPSISNGSRGVRIIDPSVDRFDLLFNHKPNSLYIDHAEWISILEGRDFPELLVSECLPGEEYTIDTLVGEDHKPLIILPRLRTRMSGGISVEGTFVREDSIIAYCRDIIGSLRLRGPIGIQVKRAADGGFRILEINPRIQGTSVSAMGLGINLPLMALRSALGEAVAFPEVRWGTRFIRYWREAYF